MSPTEGVIKFDLTFIPTEPNSLDSICQINPWRKILYMLKLIGQDPNRYGGYGYGNISMRLEPYDVAPRQMRFMISGSQTGSLPELTGDHYAIVTESDPERNRIVSLGPIRPSSESLTHAMIYGLIPHVRSVIHVHSPEIWRHAQSLGIPSTPEQASYGSPELTCAVREVIRNGMIENMRIFAMAGHEDGIVSFGESLEQACWILLKYLALAFQKSDNGSRRAVPPHSSCGYALMKIR